MQQYPRTTGLRPKHRVKPICIKHEHNKILSVPNQDTYHILDITQIFIQPKST